MKYDIEALKAIPIYDVVKNWVTLKKSHNDYKGLCPFHNEKSPSFTLHVATNRFKCFGCGASGDAIDFVAKIGGITPQKAMETISETFRIQPVDETPPPNQPAAKPVVLKGGPAAGAELASFAKRGITSKTLAMHRLTTGSEWMPKAQRQIPVMMFNYYFRGTLFNVKYRGKDKDMKMCPGARLDYYNLDAANGQDVVIVEGEFDSLAFTEAGILSNVSVPNGSQSLNFLEFTQNDFRGRRIILAGDADMPGQKLMDDLEAHYSAQGNTIVRLTWPEGIKDANEYLIKHSAKALQEYYATKLKTATNAAAVPPQDAPTPATKGDFPIQIFPKVIQDNFIEISRERNIPIDLICTAALFSVTALSGNMYETQLNGTIRNHMYALLVAPSGVGKSPAYRVVCGDVIKHHETTQHKAYTEAREAYDAAGDTKGPKPDKVPPLRPRMIKGGTMEGIMRHAKNAPAGFGVYYDEGGRMMTNPGAYKKDNNSLDFWNELWDGDNSFEARSDESRERFVPETSISVLAGMQTARLGDYFTEDGLKSGIAARFLLSSSPAIELNTDVDFFNRERRKACEEWREIILSLFVRGVDYNNFKTTIPFTKQAETDFNRLCSRRMKESNARKLLMKKEGVTVMMDAYDSKLYAYQGRLLIPLALIENLKNPRITDETVEKSRLLYDYFRSQAELLFKDIARSHATGLNENQQRLYDALPTQFTLDQANTVSDGLGFSANFFTTCFRRAFDRGGWIQREGRGKYSKNL
jgi:5S rRNA maturation endonuclease (ribonuclease M5)